MEVWGGPENPLEVAIAEFWKKAKMAKVLTKVDILIL